MGTLAALVTWTSQLGGTLTPLSLKLVGKVGFRLDVQGSSQADLYTKPRMSRQVFEPNQFILQNSETQITYSISSRVGVPHLDYQSQPLNHIYHFSGDEISVMETTIGRLITVTLESDLGQQKQRMLTLLLPTVYLPANVVEGMIQTEVILTTRRLPQPSRSRRVEGQVETYETKLLSGTARLVEFSI